jgi:hypothetical protein
MIIDNDDFFLEWLLLHSANDLDNGVPLIEDGN